MHQLAFFEAQDERNRIIAALAKNHKAYLDALREFAVAHAAQHGTVTIDDVRDTISRTDFPMPADLEIDERVFGSVFNRNRFRAVDTIPTRRLEFAQRVGLSRSSVTVYRLREVV
jgi:hypothetical protein